MKETIAYSLLCILLGPPVLGLSILIISDIYTMYYQEYVEFFWKKIKQNYIQMIVMLILFIIFVLIFNT